MLTVRNLVTGYGGAPVLHGIDLHLARGEVLGLLGRNGAGKSTFVKAIMGLLPHASGHVEFRGEPLLGLPTHRVARAGIGIVPQGRWIFPGLTVAENLGTGTRAAGLAADDVPEAVFRYFPVLKQRLKQRGGTLSGGEQQMLAIGRALCGRPKVLLLDEPSDGVQPNIVQRLGELIPALCSELEISAIVVEQNLDLVLAATHRCLVIENGRVVHEGHPDADIHTLERLLAV
ncbi:ABC transporter ATP-binding protein [Aquabacterium humicola]|uniref:ABC transporter ATP-binding protein n=1 Tax=Aquabacterium humicola TaxID=3237377 RepID=UPI002542DC9C|nr:ABC transporter ATP-binding protein [Rubrivivax pictus]